MADEAHRIVSSEFGNLLRRYRLAAGLSQEELAERARISTNGISALERGYRRNPQRETVALLANALALTDDQRSEFQVAARAGASRRIGGSFGVRSRARESTKSNLPTWLTSFVGRDDDVAEVKALVSRYRLSTLAGSGGIGKTRLAVHVGNELLGLYPDGVWFVDLAPISDPELVGSVVAQALQLTQQQGHRVDQSIPQWLNRKRLLLIFDNCEHILGPTAAFVNAILAMTQDVRILATSRQPLGISGESVYRLRPLTLPTTDNGLLAEDATRYGAIALFADRAHAADAHFLLTDKTTPIIAKICRHLDGIALAIELAAARMTVLTPFALARQLDERFRILRGGDRNALPRHQTLAAMIDWSYALLTPQEQLLFSRLSVFSGGFDLDAVEAVCCEGSLTAGDTFDLLSSLVDKSLVIADCGDERERYRLLESILAYASEKLAPAERELLACRHAAYFRRLAEATAGKRGSWGSSIAWRALVEPELDNYRVALEWALTRGNDADLGGAIATNLGHFWWAAGLAVEGLYWVELALARVSETENPALLARTYNLLCTFSAGKAALDAAERAKALFESIGDEYGAARAQRFRGGALFEMGRVDEAHEAISQALKALRQCSDDFNATNALRQLGFIEKTRGNFQQARAFYAQALAAWKARGDEVGVSFVLGSMAELEFALGDYGRALHLANEALELALTARNPPTATMWYMSCAIYRVATGDLAGARASAFEALQLARQVRRGISLPMIIQHLALIAARGNDAERAARLLGYVNAQYDHFEMKREVTEQWGYNALLTALGDVLNENEIASLGAEGAAWSEDRAIEEALSV